MARRTTAARRYAEAAFELAERDDALDAWAGGLDAAAAAVSDARVGAYLDSPAVALDERLAAVDKLLARRATPSGARFARSLSTAASRSSRGTAGLSR